MAHRRLVGGRPAVLLARALTFGIAMYLLQFGSTVLRNSDRLVLDFRGFDARPMLYMSAAIGVAYAIAWRQTWLRWAWVVVATICTWGRALSLLFIGAPDLSRPRELTGATAWAIAWMSSVLAALVLMAASLLEGD